MSPFIVTDRKTDYLLPPSLDDWSPTHTSINRTLPPASMENSKKTENYTNQWAVNSPFVTP
ncbi:MAG: hypothetical protein J5X22_02705 [Candidatus Accumulibacter sp.]|uniref:hypothetical protein n=1 Tax=Accumulibacter sp. TaxID=2053492 RepID=UPI001B2E807A|nr:hypothetical protein [Accumulibacter sp.]MBO3709450.1 hypothetical protein [Accumulibacter sp.]